MGLFNKVVIPMEYLGIPINEVHKPNKKVYWVIPKGLLRGVKFHDLEGLKNLIETATNNVEEKKRLKEERKNK